MHRSQADSVPIQLWNSANGLTSVYFCYRCSVYTVCTVTTSICASATSAPAAAADASPPVITVRAPAINSRQDTGFVATTVLVGMLHILTAVCLMLLLLLYPCLLLSFVAPQPGAARPWCACMQMHEQCAMRSLHLPCVITLAFMPQHKTHLCLFCCVANSCTVAFCLQLLASTGSCFVCSLNPLAKDLLCIDQISQSNYGLDSILLCVVPGAVYTDSGATAYDTIDGNLTSGLSSYGIGSVFTSSPTGTSYFNVTYTVQV